MVRMWRRGEPEQAVGASHPQLTKALEGALDVVEQMADQPAAKTAI